MCTGTPTGLHCIEPPGTLHKTERRGLQYDIWSCFQCALTLELRDALSGKSPLPSFLMSSKLFAASLTRRAARLSPSLRLTGRCSTCGLATNGLPQVNQVGAVLMQSLARTCTVWRYIPSLFVSRCRLYMYRQPSQPRFTLLGSAPVQCFWYCARDGLGGYDNLVAALDVTALCARQYCQRRLVASRRLLLGLAVDWRAFKSESPSLPVVPHVAPA